MKILDYLDTVRAKPEGERRRILAIWTALGMIIIVGIWLGNVLFILPKPKVSTEALANEVSLVVKVQNHIERIIIGFSTLKTLVEDKAGWLQVE